MDGLNELTIKVTETEARAKSNTKQIEDIKDVSDKHEENIEKLQEQNVTIAKLTTILDGMREDNKEQSQINRKITSTLGEIKDTIIKTNNKIESTDGKIERLAESQKSFSDKLSEIDNRVDSVDSKSKIDLLEKLKENWWGILGFVIAGAVWVQTHI